jgi:protein-L-isoaspartate(D-aspartate) O-methyltransferase
MSSDLSVTDFAAAREAMVDSQLRPMGIADPRVIAAFRSVPREDYVAADAKALAYGDRGAVGKHGGMLMAPAALAQLVQALEPVPGQRALVVGGGDEYAAAILDAMGVDTSGDDGPADMILVDGAINHLPATLTGRLREGGRLAAALRSDGVTRLVLGRKSGGTIGLSTIGDAFVPALTGFEQPQEFVF